MQCRPWGLAGVSATYLVTTLPAHVDGKPATRNVCEERVGGFTREFSLPGMDLVLYFSLYVVDCDLLSTVIVRCMLTQRYTAGTQQVTKRP